MKKKPTKKTNNKKKKEKKNQASKQTKMLDTKYGCDVIVNKLWYLGFMFVCLIVGVQPSSL